MKNKCSKTRYPSEDWALFHLDKIKKESKGEVVLTRA
jgi:hypothetical protein